MTITVRPRRRGFAPAAMADIAFLLLIFLITTTSIEDDVSLELPSFAYSRETGFPQTVRIMLDTDQNLYFNGESLELDTLLTRLVFGHDPVDTVIMFEADRQTPYRLIDEALRGLGQAGFERIVLVADSQTSLKLPAGTSP
jgi:biopolymer transport protein ExbD